MKKLNRTTRLISASLLATLTVGITGCGGGGGGSAASPNGIYTGSITDGFDGPPNGSEKGIIYNNRFMVFSTVFDIQQLFDATITVTSTSFTGTVTNYDNSSSTSRYTATLSGQFTENTSTTANFSNATPTSIADGTINLTADTALYNKGSSTATVTGSWQGTHGNNGDSTSLSVDSSGSITAGNDDFCSFTGSVIPANTSINVYNVTIISTGGTSCISLPAATYTGLAWTEDANDTTLNLTVSNGLNSRSVILTKN